jgi:hypothetical protein
MDQNGQIAAQTKAESVYDPIPRHFSWSEMVPIEETAFEGQNRFFRVFVAGPGLR